MRAAVMVEPRPIEKDPVELRDVEVPEPAAGQVLLRVKACGVCRSNLHMVEGDWVKYGTPSFTPIIPGHEVIGVVESRGPGVLWPPVGARVGVQPLWSTCGHCEYCLSAREPLCPEGEFTGETVHGGYADFMLATAAHVHVVPDNLDDAEAAPLFCPGITAYSAVANAALQPTHSVAVFGIGGVGHMVLQIAALGGSEVIAVSRGAAHRDLALELGAARVVDSSAADPGELLRGEGGVDAAIVFAPSDAVVRQAIQAVKPGGRIVLGVFADIGPFPFPEGKTLVGSVIGGRAEMEAVLRLAGAGRIRSVVDRYPLEQAPRALADLKAGRLRARAVLVP